MKTRFTVGLLICLYGLPVHAAVQLPGVFSDHMVLQRDAKVPVWGTAQPGEQVTVSFAGQSVSATANKQGKWRLHLNPLAASKEPRGLTVTGDADAAKVELKNVLVGDVWVGSGQSNMAGRLSGYAKNDETLADLHQQAPFPRIRLLHGARPGWGKADSQAVAGFSALHFAFGERLQRDLDVPIGLILGAVGGTPSGYWIPPETFAASEKCKADVAEFTKAYDPAATRRQYEKQLARWEKIVAEAKAAGKRARGRKPNPPVKPGGSMRGGKIGGLYERHIKPVVGFRIRGVLWDQGEARSGVLGVDQHTMMSELIRGWRAAWGQGEFPFLFVQKPSGGGCAFTTGDPITRNAGPFVPTLPNISRIGSGDQRFLYVRLMRDVSNAWMVPASDLGGGIHPTNKWGYGNRAAEVALSQVYNTGVQAYGPTYRDHKVEGGKVVIQFDHVGKGLAAAHSDKLQGFAVAGEDGEWRWATAEIAGETVVVWSDQVKAPTQVRYAFAQNRAWANLFNKDGRPALAFEAGASGVAEK